MTKRLKKKKKNKGGRPLFDGKNEKLVVAKLERMFAKGATDAEACLYAGISTDALYRYEERHPEFRERKQLLKLSPVLRARLTVTRDLESVGTAQWYLERKVPEEFSRQIKIGGQVGNPIEIRDKRVEELTGKILQKLAQQKAESLQRVYGRGGAVGSRAGKGS